MTQHFYGDVSNLNAPYDAIALQGLGSLTWEGKTLPSKGFVWREPSSDTLDLQWRLNPMLAQMDKCPLLVDGEMGPRTCGAMIYLNQEFSAGRFPEVPPMVSICHSPPEAPMMPKNCPAGEVPLPPAPEPEPPLPVPVKKAGISMWFVGAGIAAVAIGAAFMLKKKKRR